MMVFAITMIMHRLEASATQAQAFGLKLQSHTIPILDAIYSLKL